MAVDLCRTLTLQKSQLQLEIEFIDDVAIMHMQGGSTTPVSSRNRGSSVKALYLCPLGGGILAWVSLREKWYLTASRGGRIYYEFDSANLTVFCGTVELWDKPQLLRAEWAGWSDRRSGGAFQASEAGHPHWQIDLFESIRQPIARRFGDAHEPRDFGIVEPSPTVIERLCRAKFENVHFASAANWWRDTAEGLKRHQHGPKDETEVSRWVIGTIEYLRHQLPLCYCP